MASAAAYSEFADFLIASGISPEQLLAFHTSEEADREFRELADKRSQGPLSELEQAELNELLYFEHLVRMMKARAAHRLQLSRAS